MKQNIINVVDAPCGSGKTSWAIKSMNEASVETHKFIYVTPFLNEVSRVTESVVKREFYAPIVSKDGRTKLEHLHELLKDGKDICTTHSLFHMANKETRQLLKDHNYTLILDEVLNVIEQIPLKMHDIDLLLAAKAISVEDVNGIEYVKWNDKIKHYDTEYNKVRNMALSGNLLYFDKNALIWNFPCDIFSCFKDVYLLTYLFKGQIQRYYYDLHNTKYRFLSVSKEGGEYTLVPYDERVIHDKTKLRSLIKIYEGNLNDIGDKPYSLSSTWLKKNKQVDQLKKNAYNYFTNKLKANKDNALWTTYKASVDKVKPRNFASAFLSVNSRATNEYKERYNLAYLVDRYMTPIEKRFFKHYGVNVDESTWALSELIQWVWRSRIRQEQEINIYIPSKRMRNLLQSYLVSDDFETAPKGAITEQYASDWNF